jgi:hypothetical protein
MLNLILMSISKVIDIVNLSRNEVDRNASENIRTNTHTRTHAHTHTHTHKVNDVRSEFIIFMHF